MAHLVPQMVIGGLSVGQTQASFPAAYAEGGHWTQWALIP